MSLYQRDQRVTQQRLTFISWTQQKNNEWFGLVTSEGTTPHFETRLETDWKN